MLSFFDYAFYKLFLFANSGNQIRNRDLASSILTLLQALNALTIQMLISYLLDAKTISKTLVLTYTIVLIVFNYYRYQYSEKRNPTLLGERWSGDSLRQKKLDDSIFAAYLIATISLCIISIIFFYKKNY